ncbi:MAG TPA: PH domain-containing protein [Abditibacteriaceae bacterium]|jgi:hypothetical protein
MNVDGTKISMLFGVTALVGGVVLLANQVRYELAEDALCITYFGFCVRRVPFSNIENVRRGTALWNEHYNRVSRDPNLTLRLRRGLVRNLVINPPQTEEFLTNLQKRLH